MFETIKYETKDGIVLITVNRPQALNALNPQVLDELYKAFEQFEADENADVAILTGEGRAFVAGADIVAMSTMSTLEGRNLGIKGHKLMNYMENIEKPIIAAVNGFALGGGCELAMACDIRVASSKAKFGQPEVGLGIIPGFGGTQRLPRLVGRGMAKYLIFTADTIDAQEALRIGLVEKVVEPDALMDEVCGIAKKISAKAQLAIGLAKSAINDGYNLDMKIASKIEIESFGQLFSTEDQKEGMSAFLNKTNAAFKKK
ncbi:enoyl-CoA hydratase-related protein [Gallibacter intestinalis]|uniref:Enoyl-CoA hydratase/isomerase family protein n=1 Tax=Gallibacter intestinalis TaxID=2779356 RepID=A0ABR9QW59_9FIRM|nr:enoyl-CoA hydratase-related protein [Gallibacter intestinalis]MBE5035114.1 enoyl-CoA hydratase/isomerase family protein [Gallibacter intestinalis]